MCSIAESAIAGRGQHRFCNLFFAIMLVLPFLFIAVNPAAAGGELLAWGFNGKGELGNGTLADSNIPVAVTLPLGKIANSISAGMDHTCAVTTDGGAYCWGYNNVGQLGNGTIIDSKTPVAVTLPSGKTAASISAGSYHTCAAMTDGSAYCWGDDERGQLGGGFIHNDAMSNVPVPVLLPSGTTVASISAGGLHTCAVMTGGNAYCWGYNNTGQLGNGTITDHSAVPVAVNLPTGAASISAGSVGSSGEHTCATTTDGSAYCWGENIAGALGNGTIVNSAIPVAANLPAGKTAVSIAAGREFTCTAMTDGSAYCWGFNTAGALGNGTDNDSAVPVAVLLPSGTSVTSIGAAGGFTCAAMTDGSAYCWGNNYFGQLGNGTNFNGGTNTPVAVTLPPGYFAGNVSCGGEHIIALAGAVPFAVFTPKLSVSFGISPNTDRFELNAAISLGATSNGIAPPTEPLTIKIGTTFVATIPAGSVKPHGKQGFYGYSGSINGVNVAVNIKPGSTSSQYLFLVQASQASLSGINVNAVPVTVTIGNDSGTATVKASGL